MDKRAARIELTADDVLRNLKLVLDDAMAHDANPDKGMLDRIAALKALEMQGKHLKMWTDKTEHSGGVDITKIVHVIVRPGEVSEK